MLSGGLSTQDVSTVSQDHSPAIEPFLADQIEVLKGPSTLLYGSGAIGGVVNVVDGRIPEAAIEGGFSGRAEMRFDGATSDGNTDMVRVDGGSDRFALHADAVYRNAKDYDTPDGRRRIASSTPRPARVGGSLLGDWGFVGVSASRFEDDYGNPGEPGDLANGERGVHLQLRQDRYELKGGLTDPWGEGSGLRYSFGHTGYQHIEFEGDEPGTTFTKNANEGRVEASYDSRQRLAGRGRPAGQRQHLRRGRRGVVRAEDQHALARRVRRRAQVMGCDFQLDLGARVDEVDSDPEGRRQAQISSR